MVRWRPGAADGDWEVISGEGAAEVRHAQGGLAWAPEGAPAPAAIGWPADGDARTFDGEAWQELMVRGGVNYGPAFRVVRRVVATGGRVVARLELDPAAAGATARDLVPAPLLDGAFQVAALLGPEGDGGFRFPYALGRLEVLAPWPAALLVEASGDPATGASLVLTAEDGGVVARLSGYVTRPPRPGPAPVWLVPGWVEASQPPLAPLAADEPVRIVRVCPWLLGDVCGNCQQREDRIAQKLAEFLAPIGLQEFCQFLRGHGAVPRPTKVRCLEETRHRAEIAANVGA